MRRFSTLALGRGCCPGTGLPLGGIGFGTTAGGAGCHFVGGAVFSTFVGVVGGEELPPIGEETGIGSGANSGLVGRGAASPPVGGSADDVSLSPITTLEPPEGAEALSL